MKKIIVLIAALAACLSLPGAAYAAGEWSAGYIEPEIPQNPINKETEYIEIMTLPASEHYSAEQSSVCHISFARNLQANTYLCMENSLNGLLDENTTYDFSLCMKGTFENKGVYIGIGTNENLTSGGMVNLLKTNRYTTEDIGGGWKRYTFTDIAYDGSGNRFGIKVTQLCTGLYIDDVTLTEHGGGDELIADGGFEGVSVEETDDVGNSPDYSPRNLITTERSGHIILSWINPKKSGLSKVSIYETTTGEAVLLDDTLSKTAEDYINYDVTELEAGSQHVFRIVFEYGNTTATTVEISATASDRRPQSTMTVALSGNNPGTAYIERNDTYSQGGALRVISNLKSWKSNNYIHADTETISFSDTDEYEVSVWVKGRYGGNENPNWLNVLRPGWGNFKSAEVVEETEDGWKNIVFTTKSGTTANPLMILAEYKTDLLIDDIEVWKMSDGERQRLVYSKYFDGETVVAAPVTEYSADVDRSCAQISCTVPESAEKVRVYVKKDEELSLRAELSAKDVSVKIFPLKNDYIYTYVIKAVDKYNNESEGVELTVTPSPPDTECYDFGLYKGGASVTALDSAGTYTAKAVLKNNKLNEDYNAQIIAVLRKDGKRADAAASDIISVSKSGYDEPGTDITAEITVGDLSDGEYELSVYLWDGLGNMKILVPYISYREQEE